MEDTQVIDWEAEEEEETERSSESVGSNLEPLGRLHIFSSAHGPEKDFPLYLGENVVGRMPDCSVALPFPSISKQHAVIEILAWDKAPILRDCGSLNGTQILRPPKVLSPGVSHRLRDQELILFADLPCQYHRRLDVPLPFASRGPLAIEGTPRAQGGTRTQGLLLAEDSDDEIDPLSESCVVKGSRTTSSPLATVVPESDEEGASSARDGPGAPFGFNLNSDTDEEEGQQPASREASSAARKGAPAESKQPDVDGVAAELQLEKDQPSAKERDSDTKVERGAGNVVVPVRVILERSHPAGEDSDTDVDEDSRPPFIDSDTDVEEEGIPATPPVVPMKKKQVFRGVGMHGPGVPALAHLQKSQAGGDTGVERAKANQGSMVINSDTDDEEEVLAPFFLSHLTPKIKNGCGAGERIVEINLHFSPPDSEDLDLQATQCFVERENPSLEGETICCWCCGASGDWETRLVALEECEGTGDWDWELRLGHLFLCSNQEDGGRSNSGLPVYSAPRRTWPFPLQLPDPRYKELCSPLCPQLCIHSCFLPLSSEKNAVLSQTRRPTNLASFFKVLLRALLYEGMVGTLDEPWEVLATQPFYSRESEASETQHIAAHLEAHGTCPSRPSPPRATPQDQHPESTVHTESLGIQGRGIQTEEKGLDTPRETAESVTPEREPLEREAKELPPEGEREDGLGKEELTRGLQDREQEQVLARDLQRQESDIKMKSANAEWDVKSLKVEMETSKEIQEKEREAQRPVPEKESEPAELEVKVPKEVLEETGTQRGETKGSGSQNQKGEASLPTPEPGVGAGALQGLASAPIAPGSQSGRGRVAPVSPTRQRRGRLNWKMPPAEKTSRGGQESPDAFLPPSVPEASATFQNLPISQSQKHPILQPLLSPSLPSSATPIPKLEPLYPKPKVRPRGSSRVTPSPVSSTALEPHPPTPTDQPVSTEPTPWVTQGKTRRSSVKIPEPVEPTAPELQPSTSTDQPVTLNPLSRATRGRTHRSSVRTPEPVEPTAPKLQPSTSTDQPVTLNPLSRATRGRTHRSSVKTSEPVEPTASEVQPSTSTDQPVTAQPISQATRGRTRRSSVRTPGRVEHTASELQSSTFTDQPVTSKPTRGRTPRSSVKTPKPIVATAPKLQSSTSTHQPVTPKPISRATRGRTNRSSVKTPEPIEPTAPDLKLPTPTDQSVTSEPILWATQGRTHRFSVKTPEPFELTALELQPSTSKDQFVTPKSTSRSNQDKTHRFSLKTPEPFVPISPDLKPLNPTDQPVTPEPIGSQSKTLKSSTVSAVPVPVTSEFQPPVPTDQPIPAEPIPQPSCNRRQRATRKHESLTAPIVHEPCCTPHEPKSQSSRTQRRGALRAATMDSPPPQKQPQRREVPQKTELPKEEQEGTAERPGKKKNIVIPGPVKRKRDQKEEEPRGTQSRNLRRTKSNQESVAPKVLFTGVVDARGERAVLALGGSLANSVTEASHLVTDRIRRTVKFLCALGRGIPILSLDWLHQSRKAGCFLPPDEYVVTDPEQEKNFGFSLRDALSRAQKRRLLEGYEIHVTPGVQPPPTQMGEIISCCGGTVLPNMPRSYKPQRVVITCSQDFARCSIPCRIGLPLLSPEFLLTGVLKQEANPEAFTLSTSEMSST
uniref:Mediator of DNA damage checkpoint protein 1 n=1 Tax=Loxodonta africana TaxID=9785 RepID=G3TIN2_LOXAF